MSIAIALVGFDADEVLRIEAFIQPIYCVVASFPCSQSLQQKLRQLEDAKIRAIVLQASLPPSDLLDLGSHIGEHDWAALSWGAPRLLSLASIDKLAASRMLSFAHTASDPVPRLVKTCLTDAHLLAKPGWKPPPSKVKMQMGTGQAWISPPDWGVAPKKSPSSPAAPPIRKFTMPFSTTPLYEISNVGNIQRLNTNRSQSSLGSEDLGVESVSSREKLIQASRDVLLGPPAAKYVRTGRGLIRVA